MNHQELLSRAVKDLLLSDPFYGTFLIMMNKVWSESIPTMGVSRNGIDYQLIINKAFLDGVCTTNEHRTEVLKHECLHIAFSHLTMFDHLSDKEIRNICFDIEVNAYLNRDKLPGKPVFHDSFPNLGLEPKKGTSYYYEKLLKEKNKNDSKVSAIAGAMQRGEPQAAGHDVPDHHWEDLEDLSDAEKQVINTQLGHILKEVADQIEKSRGTIPGEFKDIIERLRKKEPPKFDWKNYVRRLIGRSEKIETKLSYSKLNLRYPDMPGLKIKPRKHLLLGIDTSGSVSKAELQEFLGEMDHIHKMGNDITIVQADAAIRSITKFKSGDRFEIHGRGGTDFNPAVSYYNEHLNKFTCMIYFTDGEAPDPDPKPRGKFLWVISSLDSKELSSINLTGPKIKLKMYGQN